MKLLGALEKPFYAAVNPLVERLIRAGVRPNTITTVGTGLVLVSAVAYGLGHIRLGGALLLLSGLADTLDGQVARGGAMVTKFGAFYDSTLDRVGDGATFIGIGAFLLTGAGRRLPDPRPSSSAWSPSSARSWSPTPGPGPKDWASTARWASRSGRSGSGSGSSRCSWARVPHALVLEGIVALLAVASMITVVQRFVYVYRTPTDVGGRAAGPQTSSARRSILSRKDIRSG